MNSILIQHWQTNQGVRVFFVERHELPMLEMSVDFAAGSAHDGSQFGVSHLTNVMLPQGTQRFDANQIATGFKEVGAHYSVTCDRDLAIVYLRTLTEQRYFKRALHLFTQMLHAPIFPENHFLRMKKIVLSALMQQTQIPEIIAKNKFYSTIYQNHPYGHTVLGTIETVSALTIEDLKNFYKKYYTTKNALITLVGDLSRKKAEQIADHISQSLVHGNRADNIPIAEITSRNTENIVSFPSEQTHILMGQVGINYENKNYFPLLLGNSVLGSTPFISRLFKEVRGKHGLVYNIFSGLSMYSGKGPFFIIFQTHHAKTLQALKLTRKVFEDYLKKGPTKEELNRVKKKIINSFPLSLARNEDISNHLVKIGFYHLPLNYLDEYCEKINAVTLKQIKNAFQSYFYPYNLITVRVGYK